MTALFKTQRKEWEHWWFILIRGGEDTIGKTKRKTVCWFSVRLKPIKMCKETPNVPGREWVKTKKILMVPRRVSSLNYLQTTILNDSPVSVFVLPFISRLSTRPTLQLTDTLSSVIMSRSHHTTWSSCYPTNPPFTTIKSWESNGFRSKSLDTSP